ncbi:MAG: hypothetical protein J1E64_15545 [Acetatifactor sp.]|nr:hypothetical protein [Acetatifactor sp.]
MDNEQIKALRQFTDNDLRKLNGLKKMCSFSELKETDVTGLLKDYNTLCGTDRGLWAIFGKGKGIDNWTCLHVGSSKDIKSELLEIFKLMISEPKEKKKSTTFHKEVYDFWTYMDKTSQKYRSMYNLCKKFVVFEIDIHKYLEGIDTGKYGRVEYAEVKFAYETKALYWNPAPAMNGNKEKEIYKNEFVDPFYSESNMEPCAAAWKHSLPENVWNMG